jgi:excisionase family DNA binding protein
MQLSNMYLAYCIIGSAHDQLPLRESLLLRAQGTLRLRWCWFEYNEETKGEIMRDEYFESLEESSLEDISGEDICIARNCIAMKVIGKEKSTNKTTTADDLPLYLGVTDITALLNIGRSTAYEMFNSAGFPKSYVGSQMRVRKDDFMEWMRKQN